MSEFNDFSGDGTYLQNGNCLYRLQKRNDDIVKHRLSNFSAKIVTEEICDLGDGQVHVVFEVEGAHADGRKLPTVRVASQSFTGMGLVLENWGAAAIIAAGGSNRDHLRAAIQFFSGMPARRFILGHLGWKFLDDQWKYIHSDGVIAANGTESDVCLDLSKAKLECYRLPQHSKVENLAEFLRGSLRFLSLADRRITFPIYAAIFRSVISEFLPVDFGIFLEGPSGSQKSELSAMALTHFGSGFHRLSLPANWSSTANYLEQQAFLAKDVLLVIDDWAPSNDLKSSAVFNAAAERIFRSQGNLGGRGRMTKEGGLSQAAHPRGLILSTGEDVPHMQSIKARLLILSIKRGDVDLSSLTDFQAIASSGTNTHVMTAYITWLARNIETVCNEGRNSFELYREKFSHSDKHHRAISIAASLAVGLKLFFRFCAESNLLNEDEASELLQEGELAIVCASDSHAEMFRAENPEDRFIQLIKAILYSQDAHLASRDGNGPPPMAHLFGWKTNARVEPSGPRIGWFDGKFAYLDGETSWAAAQELSRRQGQYLSATLKGVIRRLVDRGIAVKSPTEKDRNLVRMNLEGERQRAILLADYRVLVESSGTGGTFGTESVPEVPVVP